MFDAGPSEQVLGIEYTKLETTLVCAVNSLRAFGTHREARDM
jgi:hypothetical protein